MAELHLQAAPALGGFTLTLGENRIEERADLALVSVATPSGGETTLARAFEDNWQLSLPGASCSSVNGDLRAIRTAPDQLMLMFAHATPDAAQVISDRLQGAGYVTDQTDAWVILEISGPATLSALERICPLDLDPAGFPVDAAARTAFEHMGAMMVRLSDTRFLLLSARSSAVSFLHAVETSYRFVLP